MTSCDKSFGILLHDLHNSCSLSNIMYILAGLVGIFALPGWWRLFGVAVLMEAAISFINHSNMAIAGISSATWRKMDVGCAIIGCVATLALVIIKRKKLSKRNVFICVAIFATALLFLGVSESQANRVVQKDPVKDLGLGNPLAEEKITTNYDTERYQVLYLSYHTSWHIVSGMSILVMLVVLAPVL